MNQKQKQVNKQLLAEEKDVVRNLKDVYTSALDEVKKKIAELSQHENMQSKVYQKKYQQALYDQLSETVKLLDSGKIKNVDDFLYKTAETSFIGTLYEFNEDVPLLLPIDNKSIAGIVNKKTEGFKFSQRLHRDTKQLARVTVSEISRGLSVGLSYQDMARNISNVFASDFKKAYRIAQTEGHRISQETAFDTAKRFREKGADIVKQWDSTMDRKTRPHHVKLDGQTKELDEPFEVEGHKAMYPGAFGIAKEDIRCRCVMVKRARWALGTDETKFDGEKDKIVKIKVNNFENFKKQYKMRLYDSNGNELYDYLKSDIIQNVNDTKQLQKLFTFKIYGKEINPFDRSFEKFSFDTQKEIADGMMYMQENFGMSQIKSKISYARLKGKTGVFTMDSDGKKVIKLSSTLDSSRKKEAYPTIIHELTHDLDSIHYGIAEDIIKTVYKKLGIKRKSKLDIKYRYEIIGNMNTEYLMSDSELLCSSIEKEACNSSSNLSKEIYLELQRRIK